MIKRILKKIINNLPYIKRLIKDRDHLIAENKSLKQSSVKSTTEILENDYQVYFNKKS